jgi:peptidoglycan hydrolase-like protein with peptidoglycan-binding domain
MAVHRRIRSNSLADKLSGLVTGRRMSSRTKLIILCAVIVAAGGIVAVFIFSSKPLAEVGSINSPAPLSVATPSPTPSPTPIPTTTPMVTPDLTLKKGDENESVSRLQEKLMDLGYLDIDEPTQKFGPATEMAVNWFQRQHGLEQTGIADGDTLGWIYSREAKKYALLEGTRGSDVDSLQRKLKELGYLNKVTGYYGKETEKAVKDFQKRNKLTVDGKTGEQTLDCIYSPRAKLHPSKIAAIQQKTNIDKLIAAAQKQLGKRYVSGAEGPNYYDCSGLVYYCLKQAGSTRGRYNAAGYAKVSEWPKVDSISKLKRGDLMFFWSDSKNKIGHVAIYIGGGMMIDASSSHGKVVKRSATTNWCKKNFRLGRRPL